MTETTRSVAGRPAYERLEAWAACHALTKAVYVATGNWPASERFGLSSQVRRAAWSATASIAEGSAKRGPREFARFLDVANGSVSEVRYGLRLAAELGYVPREDGERLDQLLQSASRLTWCLYRSIRRAATHPRMTA